MSTRVQMCVRARSRLRHDEENCAVEGAKVALIKVSFSRLSPEHEIPGPVVPPREVQS